MTTKVTMRYFKRRVVNGEREDNGWVETFSSSFRSDFPNSHDDEIDTEHSVSTSDPDNKAVEDEQLSSSSPLLAKEVSENDRDFSFRLIRFFAIISFSSLLKKTTVFVSIEHGNSIFMFCVSRSILIDRR